MIKFHYLAIREEIMRRKINKTMNMKSWQGTIKRGYFKHKEPAIILLQVELGVIKQKNNSI